MSGLLFRLFCLPRVEECAIQQSAIVMVAYIVGDLHGSVTLLWLVVSLNLHLVFCVPDIKQKHIKVQDRIRGDDVTCRGSIQCCSFLSYTNKSKDYTLLECVCTLSNIHIMNSNGKLCVEMYVLPCILSTVLTGVRVL